MTLSVLHFSTADNEGGSGRSAYRIHAELRRRGNRSRMLVGHKVTADADVETVSGGRILRKGNEVAERICAKVGLQYQMSPSGPRLLRHPWLAMAQIIQLYNTHGGYLSHRLLPKLAGKRPVVWRLSDMWPVTGHCAYAADCARWESGCGACPDLAGYPAIGRDTTAFLWRQKREIYRKLSLTVVAPSSWIEGIAKRSPLFAGRAVHRIPNGLDLAVFRPLEQAAVRDVFGVPKDCVAILYAPQVAARNARKGSDVLESILRCLGPRENVVLLVAGAGGEEWVGKVPQTVIPLGYLRDDRLIAMANAAADVVAIPSAVENLPNTAIEGLACARPMVAFDAGGMRDAVRPEETGVLVAHGDVQGFADALSRLLDDEPRRQAMGVRGLELARREFSAKLQGERFEELYRSLLEAA